MKKKALDYRIPNTFAEYGECIMSNLGHIIDIDVAEAIKNKPFFSQYSGWDFCGYVWWQADKWHCEIWTYRSWRETISADTLEIIMVKVCDTYGYD